MQAHGRNCVATVTSGVGVTALFVLHALNFGGSNRAVFNVVNQQTVKVFKAVELVFLVRDQGAKH